MRVIHGLLDELLDLLDGAGSPVATQLGDPPPEPEVRAALRSAGFDDRDEVVAFLTWRGYPDPRRVLGANLFWETMYPQPFDAAISFQQGAIEDVGVGDRERWPGPPTWLPIAILDGAEFMSVDCGTGPDAGAVWHLFTQDDNQRMFDSLAVALETAVYCLRAGLWQVEDEDGVIACDRTSQPSELDLEHPPWYS